MIEIKDLRKTYKVGNEKVHALNGVNAIINDGESVAVVGKSGSGKTTLLNMLGGMDSPTSGSVVVDGEGLSGKKEKALSEYRLKKIGFVFQFFNLVPVLTVRENMMLPLLIAGSKVDKDFFDELSEKLGILDKLDVFPEQLSGGQKQRVAIGRALIHRPSLILADEPTGNLDSATSAEVLDLLLSCVKEYNETMVMVTHDMEVADRCDRKIEMKDGIFRN